MSAFDNLHTRLDKLIQELDVLSNEYQKAVRSDCFFEVKKQLRLKIKKIQDEIMELRSQYNNRNESR